MKKHAHAIVGALICLPILALAQFPSIPSLKSVAGLGSVPSTGGDASGQNDALVRGCVAANKDVLIANSQMVEALGLKDQAAASKATADALTDGAIKGNLEDSNKAVSAFTDAPAAEITKGPKPDAAAKVKYQAGVSQLGQGMLKYIALCGICIVGQLPRGQSNLSASTKDAAAFSKSNDIPVPPDATKAMASL